MCNEEKHNSKIPEFVNLNEVASESNGGKIIFATDDWFASAECMIQDSEPIFIEDKYTLYGKWMDGWETRRKRIAGHDWSIIMLGTLSVLKGISVDTAFFTGNYAPRISIQAANLNETEKLLFPCRMKKIGEAASEDEFKVISKLKSEKWQEIVPMSKLKPGYTDTRMSYFKVDAKEKFTHLRVNMYPDGGIARLRVYADVQPNLNAFLNNNTGDLLSMENGGKCITYSNAHYGHPRNLMKTGKGKNMGDGWETARRLDRPPILRTDDNGILKVPGNEWAIFKLCCRGQIENVIVDTNHFKGNYPDNVKLEGLDLNDKDLDEEEIVNLLESSTWKTLLNPHKLGPDREHEYTNKHFSDVGPYTYVKITMAPDGGISRIRMLGTLLGPLKEINYS